MTKRFKKLLITGAAGNLGHQLRLGLAHLAETIRLVDRLAITDLKPHEEAMCFDLTDLPAAEKAMQDVDALVHFGAAPVEKPWAEILNSNIIGTYNIYEAARKAGIKRVIYASSLHSIGYYQLEDQLDAKAPHRPDSLYGVSKCFGEDLARLYFDKFGMESVALRIFSCVAEPKDRRMIWSWLSYPDLIRLVTASLLAPRVGFTISYGLSDNKVKPVDNRFANHLGYYPQDNTEPFRAAMEASTPEPDPSAPSVKAMGGWFIDLGHPDDEKD